MNIGLSFPCRDAWKVSCLVFCVASILQIPVDAHFLWLTASSSGDEVECYFSEGPSADDPELLRRLGDLTVNAITGSKTADSVKLAMAGDRLVGSFSKSKPDVVYLAHTYGEFSRGDTAFLLKYLAIAQRKQTASLPQPDSPIKDAIVLFASQSKSMLKITATFNGKPVAAEEVTIVGPDGTETKQMTGADGTVEIAQPARGLYAFRIRRVASVEVSWKGTQYDQVREYTTLTCEVAGKTAAVQAMPDLPNAITSFGAAVADGYIWTYGGHKGSAHSYHRDAQSNTLHRLSLANPEEWEAVATGPNLQGLALVAHKRSLYRIGGFTAINGEDADHDLVSQAVVSRFDLDDKAWHEMPSLPEPRSSMDAMVVGDDLYVVGGWSMQGKDSETKWHETAWRLDLSDAKAAWVPIAKPPFQRRAVALAAFDGRLFVLGGMQQKGGPTTRVDIYDPRADRWSRGPDMIGEPMSGFGCSAFATQGSLYVSTVDGVVQELTRDESAWEQVGELSVGRFFHRMLTIRPGTFVLLAGANMEIGKFADVEQWTVAQ